MMVMNISHSCMHETKRLLIENPAYIQNEGIAISNLLSPFLENLFINRFEMEAS